jgi:hypothetical protein
MLLVLPFSSAQVSQPLAPISYGIGRLGRCLHNTETRRFVVVYNFVIAVAQLLKSRQELALVDIVDKLDNENLLKPQPDEERAMPNHIVFAAVGWLSAYLKPREQHLS